MKQLDTMAAAKKATLKLLVDKEKKRVVFAESDEDFVETLFGFLGLPVATIVERLGKQSSVGCIDRLFESVEKLDRQYFHTEACKEKLLHPHHVDDTGMFKFRRNGVPLKSEADSGTEDNAAVSKGMDRFMISDDLRVEPASTAAILALLDKLGITDGSVLEERSIDLGKDELLNLLKRSLLSKSPLSGICFQDPNMVDDFEISVRTQPIIEKVFSMGSKKVKAKALICKSNNRVVYAEAGEGLVDLLFSFLTQPLGSIVRLLDKQSCIGCIDNLYDSWEILSKDLRAEESKTMAVSKRLPHDGPRKALLAIDDKLYRNGSVPKYHSTIGQEHVYTKEMKFTITDDMQVTPFSPLSSIQITKRMNSPISALEEREFGVGETEALYLLKACMISHSPLTEIFLPPKKMKNTEGFFWA